MIQSHRYIKALGVLAFLLVLLLSYPNTAHATTTQVIAETEYSYHGINSTPLTWIQARSATTANIGSGSSATGYTYSTVVGGNYQIFRSFLHFDLRDMESDYWNYEVTSATVSIYVTGNYASQADEYVYSGLTIPIEDYTSPVPSDELGNFTDVLASNTTTLNGTGWKRYQLTEAGLEHLNSDFNFWLNFREGNDISDHTPTAQNGLNYRTVNYSGTTSDPYIRVEYSLIEEQSTSSTTIDLSETNNYIIMIGSIILFIIFFVLGYLSLKRV